MTRRNQIAAPLGFQDDPGSYCRLSAVGPNAVDAETAAETFKLDTDSRDRLRRLFEQNDEWQYSGTHNGPGKISPENRRDVLELIENLKA